MWNFRSSHSENQAFASTYPSSSALGMPLVFTPLQVPGLALMVPRGSAALRWLDPKSTLPTLKFGWRLLALPASLRPAGQLCRKSHPPPPHPVPEPSALVAALRCPRVLLSFVDPSLAACLGWHRMWAPHDTLFCASPQAHTLTCFPTETASPVYFFTILRLPPTPSAFYQCILQAQPAGARAATQPGFPFLMLRGPSASTHGSHRQGQGWFTSHRQP